MAGLTFDEFKIGQVFTHQPSRTVTETDNLLFSTLTMNVQPLHLDAEFAKTSHFGQRFPSLPPTRCLDSRSLTTFDARS